MKIIRVIDHWLQIFGFRKKQKSIKEKMCIAACELKERYVKEAKEATANLRMEKNSKQVA